LYFLDRFDMLMSKMIFKKWKNNIDMYFSTKNYLKSNCYHTANHTLRLLARVNQHYVNNHQIALSWIWQPNL
jgi:hypothetical protein